MALILLVIVSQELAKATDHIVLPSVHPLVTSLVAVIPTQLLAYFATLQRGHDVDKPRNLAKSSDCRIKLLKVFRQKKSCDNRLVAALFSYNQLKAIFLDKLKLLGIAYFDHPFFSRPSIF